MGHKFTKEELLTQVVSVALEDGFSQLTFGRVARQLGISDRMVVYYFPSKDDLVTEVLVELGAQMQAALADAFLSEAPDHVTLARAAWPRLSRAEFEPIFSLFFEASGLAVAGQEPYRTVVAAIVDAWAEWLTGFLPGPKRQRRSEALATIALVDGLMLVRHTAGDGAARQAARALGVLPRPHSSRRP